jgi:transcriptional regulator with XRE-family HTH domain
MEHMPVGDVLPACRPLGAFIRRERERRGLTRKELAAMVRRTDRTLGTSERTIARWELRGAEPLPAALRALAAVFELPVERLVTLAAGKLDREGEDTRRREFTKLAALGALGALLPDAVDLERIVAGSARSLDLRTLEELETITVSYGRLWKVSPPGALLPAVHAQLGVLGRLLPAGRQLHAMASDVATLAGYLAFEAEDRGRASAYWGLARRLASDVGGETECRALIAASVLHSTVSDGGAPAPSGAALALLDAAEARTGRRASRLLRGWRLARRAEEHAAMGHGHAADADMAAADASLREPDACCDAIIGPRDASQLDGFRGSVAVLLGRYSEAASVLRRSLDTMPDGMVAWRSVVSADMGAALAGMGEAEGAAAALSSALDLAAEAGAPEHARRVRGVRQRHLARYSDVAAVRQLDERLFAAL